MDKTILGRLKRLEDSNVADGVTILMPADGGGWQLSGGMRGTFPNMEAAIAHFERHKRGADTPLIVIDV